jgi:predicted acyltransferase
VDVFRGVTIVAMILVNNPGDWNTVYPPLLHAAWHGWTPTDLIFPFFLFIVGTAIVLALGRRLEAAGDGLAALRKQLVGKIVRRSLTLFGLGLFLSGYPFGLFGSRTFERLLETWRIPGVLQRIALCYLVVALMFLFLRTRALKIWAAALLFGYWLLLTQVPVPGVGAPDLASKGDHLAGWLDRIVFGNHLWISAKVYDPEGLLSTLPALATTLSGVFAGLILISRRDALDKAVRLFAGGTCLAVAGSVWGWFFPINKALWTSSYAVLTAGLAFSALGLCYWFFDIEKHPRLAKPFTVYGLNSITVFVGSGVLARTVGSLRTGGADSPTLQAWLYQTLFASWLPPYPASLAYAMAWVLGWFAVLAWMSRRGWVWKV